jgi:hypothetical protein
MKISLDGKQRIENYRFGWEIAVPTRFVGREEVT